MLLDYTTAYGIRLFEPFNWRWYSWDIVFIVEPLILLALILGLVMPALFGLVNQEIGARSKGLRGRGGAVFALTCLVLIWGFRDYQHRRALNAMGSVLYQRSVPVKMGAYPYWVNPFRWHGVVETESFFQTVPVNSMVPEVDAQGEAHTYFKPEETPVTQAAKASYFGRVYLDWAVFPLTQTEKLEGPFNGYLVRFRRPALRVSGDARQRQPGRLGADWSRPASSRRGNKLAQAFDRRKSLRTELDSWRDCRDQQITFLVQITSLDAIGCGVQNQRAFGFHRADFLR